MLAIRVYEYGPPAVMKLEETPEPTPEPGQVLIRLHAAGVNPVETYIRSGNYASLPDSLPYTPGSDGAGEIVELGEGVTGFKEAERVYVGGLGIQLPGSYAQYAVAPVANVHSLPERLSFEQGAAIPIAYPTAYVALDLAHPVPGETVLIHGGSGSVGTAATQLAQMRGLRIICSAGSERGRELVVEQGAEAAVDHNAADEAQTVLAMTGGKGPDIILEMLANVNLARDLEMIAMRGRIIVVGNRGTIEINPRLAMRREATIRGMLLFNVPPAELAQVHEALRPGFESGALDPVVGQTLPLAEASAAHEAVLAPGSYGKIVLEIP